MESSTSLIVIALAALAVGLVVGYLLTRSLHPQAKQRRELEDKLANTLEEHKQYQHDVTQHFMATAERVNDLTESYRDLHEHLASGAMQLTSPEISRQLLNAGYGDKERGLNVALIDPANAPTPPKDYAPKAPGGVLSEDYGLENDTPSTDTPTPTDSIVAEADENLDDDPTLKVG